MSLLAALTVPQLMGAVVSGIGMIGSGINAFKKHPNHGAIFEQFLNPNTNFSRFSNAIGGQNAFNMANAGRIANATGYSPAIAGMQAAGMNRQIMGDAYNSYMPMANEMALKASGMKAESDMMRFENDMKSRLSFWDGIMGNGFDLLNNFDADQMRGSEYRDKIKYPEFYRQQQGWKDGSLMPDVNRGGISVPVPDYIQGKRPVGASMINNVSNNAFNKSLNYNNNYTGFFGQNSFDQNKYQRSGQMANFGNLFRNMY